MVRSHPVAAAALPLPRAGPDESGEHARLDCLRLAGSDMSRVGLPIGPGRRAMFAHDAQEAGLSSWATKVPGTTALVSLPAWVVLLRDALTNVTGPQPIGFRHWVLSRAGELPRPKREQFASACDALVRLDARAAKAITELLDMMSEEARGEIGAPRE